MDPQPLSHSREIHPIISIFGLWILLTVTCLIAGVLFVILGWVKRLLKALCCFRQVENNSEALLEVVPQNVETNIVKVHSLRGNHSPQLFHLRK